MGGMIPPPIPMALFGLCGDADISGFLIQGGWRQSISHTSSLLLSCTPWQMSGAHTGTPYPADACGLYWMCSRFPLRFTPRARSAPRTTCTVRSAPLHARARGRTSHGTVFTGTRTLASGRVGPTSVRSRIAEAEAEPCPSPLPQVGERLRISSPAFGRNCSERSARCCRNVAPPSVVCRPPSDGWRPPLVRHAVFSL